jgi:1-carboxybiuret hydrolase subunit AtzH-like protein
MMDVTVNIPEVVAEVRTLFERYEQALIDKNVEVLDATFWDSPHTIATRSTSTAMASRRSTRTAWRARRPGHREPRIQGAWSGRDRPSEPDVGALPRPWLEGHQRARLGNERAAPADLTDSS